MVLATCVSVNVLKPLFCNISKSKVGNTIGFTILPKTNVAKHVCVTAVRKTTLLNDLTVDISKTMMLKPSTLQQTVAKTFGC